MWRLCVDVPFIIIYVDENISPSTKLCICVVIIIRQLLCCVPLRCLQVWLRVSLVEMVGWGCRGSDVMEDNNDAFIGQMQGCENCCCLLSRICPPGVLALGEQQLAVHWMPLQRNPEQLWRNVTSTSTESTPLFLARLFFPLV